MYKIYLSPALDKNAIGKKEYGYDYIRVGSVTDSVEQQLINDGKYLVFRNMEDMTENEIIEDSNSIKPNVHIAIHTKTGGYEGLEIEVNEDNVYSTALGREIGKRLKEIYHTKKEKALKYSNKNKEIADTTSPAIIIYLGCRDNDKDISWIINNVENIGAKIAEGVEEYFRLKKC